MQKAPIGLWPWPEFFQHMSKVYVYILYFMLIFFIFQKHTHMYIYMYTYLLYIELKFHIASYYSFPKNRRFRRWYDQFTHILKSRNPRISPCISIPHFLALLFVQLVWKFICTFSRCIRMNRRRIIFDFWPKRLFF